MKRFLAGIACLCCVCLVFAVSARACCPEESLLTTEEEVLAALGATEYGNGFQVDPDLAIDEVSEVLSCIYHVEDSFLSIVIGEREGDKWGYFDKQSYFLMTPQFDLVGDFCTTDPDSPILCGQNEKYGYVSRMDGSVMIPFVFTGYCELSEFYAGYALGCNVRETDDAMIFSNVLLRFDGTVIEYPDGIMPISHPYGNLVLIEYDLAVDSDADVQLVGIGNTAGEVLIPPAECNDFLLLYSYFYPYQECEEDYE